MDQLLLKPEQVAQTLGISRAKTYSLLASGTIPSFMLGANRRVARRDLEVLIDRLRAGETLDDIARAPIAATA